MRVSVIGIRGGEQVSLLAEPKWDFWRVHPAISEQRGSPCPRARIYHGSAELVAGVRLRDIGVGTAKMQQVAAIAVHLCVLHTWMSHLTDAPVLHNMRCFKRVRVTIGSA